MELYNLKRYEDLKDGEPIVAFGRHVVQWNFDTMGEPAYGFVPASPQEILAAYEGEIHSEDVDSITDVSLLKEMLKHSQVHLKAMRKENDLLRQGLGWYVGRPAESLMFDGGKRAARALSGLPVEEQDESEG